MTNEPAFGLIAPLVAPIESGAAFGPLTAYYRALIELVEGEGWHGYVFSPRDVLRQRRTIWGWSRRQGTWVRSFVPPPTIAYTRLPFLPLDAKAILLWLRDEAGTLFINQPELDEMTQDYWRLTQILQSHPTLGAALLDSILVRDTSSLSTLLAEHPHVLVRPRLSGPGQGGGSLERRADEYLLRYEQGRTGHTRTFRSIVKLRGVLEELFGEVVVQQYLPPFRIEGCPVTIRSVWQRTAQGQWREGAVILRVGHQESQTYRTVTLGLLDRYQDSLQALLGSQLKAIQYQVTNLGQTAVELLSQRSRGAGELALEFLVSEQRSVKLLEVSTLGGLEAVRRLPDPRAAQAMKRTTLGYAQYLQQQAQATVPTGAPIETP